MATTHGNERFYQLAMDRVAALWGLSSIDKVGPRLYRALFLEQVLLLAAGLDEHWSDAKVRLMVEGAPGYIDEVIQRGKGLPS